MQEQVRGNTLLLERTISISTEGLCHAAISVTEQPFVPFRVEESRALSKGLRKHREGDGLSGWINSNLESEGIILE